MAVLTKTQLVNRIVNLLRDDAPAGSILPSSHQSLLVDVLDSIGGLAPPKAANIRIEPFTIQAPADLDGNYNVFVGQVPYTNAQVNQLEVWFGSEAIHEVSPFRPESGPIVVPINVSTSEETQIGLAADADWLQVLVVYRLNGNYVGQDACVLATRGQGDAVAREALLRRIGDSITYVSVADAAAFQSEVEAHGLTDQSKLIHCQTAVDVTFQALRYNYPKGQLVYFAERSTLPFPWFVLPTGGGGEGLVLTNQQKAELIDLRLGIVAINPTEANLQRQIDVFFDPPAILGPAVYAEFRVAGQGPAARQLMAQAGGKVSFTLTKQQAEAIADNVTDDQTTIDVNINLYDAANAGNSLATVHRDLTILRPPVPMVQTLVSAAAVAWAMGNGLTADLTLAHNATITPSGGNDGDTAILRVVQDATGGRTLAFAAGVQTGGRRVGLSNAAGKRTLIGLHRIGAVWHYVGSVLDA